MSIHPELTETFECVICYESNVELVSICTNKHNLCKTCVTRIKEKCPFCRQRTIHEHDDDIELGHVEPLGQEEPHVSTSESVGNIETVVPEYIQRQTQTCSCLVPFTYLSAIIFLSYVFVTNVKHYGPAEQVMFFILILMLTIAMLLFCKKAC